MEGGMEQAATPTPSKKKARGAVSRQLGRTALVGLAGVLAIAMVGSVLALLTDTVNLSDGYATSNDWDGGPDDPNAALDLRIKTGACDAATDDITDTAVFVDTDVSISGSNIELDLASLADLGPGEFSAIEDQTVATLCLANASTYTGELVMSVIGSSSEELGLCGAAEAAHDTTCDPAIPGTGELDAFTYIQARGSCTNGGPLVEFQFDDDYTDLADLPVGQTCELVLNLNTYWVEGGSTGPSDEGLLKALTDSISFDLAIDLQAI